MADAKALLESIARSFGYYYGTKKKVRVNTISQSPTYTTAGSGVKGFNRFFTYAEKMSPLGNASSEDCANFCITLFSDLTKMVTMQKLEPTTVRMSITRLMDTQKLYLMMYGKL